MSLFDSSPFFDLPTMAESVTPKVAGPLHPVSTPKSSTIRFIHSSPNPVDINHISDLNLTIQVSSKRLNRILHQRRKRMAFLNAFPKYSLPYKSRPKGPKYDSRSKVAKDRKRDKKGRLANLKIGQEPPVETFTGEVSSIEEESPSEPSNY